MTTAQSHWPASIEAFINSHLAAKPPLGGSPISDSPPRPSVEERHRHCASGAAEAGDAVMTERLGNEAGGQEHRRLGEGVGQSLHDSAAKGVRRPGAVG